MFRAAGFPPDVVNLVVHRPKDAQGYFEALISHPAVRHAVECGPRKDRRDGAAGGAAEPRVQRSVVQDRQATRTSWQTHPDFTRKKQVHKSVTRTYKACTLDWESVVPPGVMQCATRQ
ncbi:hypothetical protein M0657_010588 [Pyricularia oryzae]|nr:hypothetical protein M9X92_011422 [Pyricularia oryzae]KAI7912160.1 hypothetical protein M0657_010588 [Pyricularia oryzae]